MFNYLDEEIELTRPSGDTLKWEHDKYYGIDQGGDVYRKRQENREDLERYISLLATMDKGDKEEVSDSLEVGYHAQSLINYIRDMEILKEKLRHMGIDWERVVKSNV